MEDGKPKSSVYAVTSGFIVDSQGRFPVLFRGPNVRSAKNAWSLPSGLHDCGRTMFEQLAVEAKEELNLDVVGDAGGKFITAYENIAQVDSFHWLISLVVVPCSTFDTLKNLEPDKHADVQLKTASYIESGLFLKDVWAPGLKEAIHAHSKEIVEAIKLSARIAHDFGMPCDS